MPEADGDRLQALGEAMVGAAGEQVGPLDPWPIDAFGVAPSGLIYGHEFKPVLIKSCSTSGDSGELLARRLLRLAARAAATDEQGDQRLETRRLARFRSAADDAVFDTLTRTEAEDLTLRADVLAVV